MTFLCYGFWWLSVQLQKHMVFGPYQTKKQAESRLRKLLSK